MKNKDINSILIKFVAPENKKSIIYFKGIICKIIKNIGFKKLKSIQS